MPIKIQRLLNIFMVILAWGTIPFLGFHNIKRFLPSSLLIVIIEAITVQIGKRRKWWFFYNKPKSYINGEFPFNIGPFLIGAMWILKWTFGNIKRFIILNAIVDGIFTFFVTNIAKKIKLFTLVRLNKIQFFTYIFSKAFLLYLLQYIIENKKSRGNNIYGAWLSQITVKGDS